jgi:hypothetical protein
VVESFARSPAGEFSTSVAVSGHRRRQDRRRHQKHSAIFCYREYSKYAD